MPLNLRPMPEFPLQGRSGVRDRLPLAQPVGDQIGALPIIVTVEDAHVRWLGAPIDAGGARVHLGTPVRSRREVPGGAIGRLDQDLTGAVELGCVRVPGTFTLPGIEDTRRVAAFLRSQAPVPRRQPAILLPRAAGDLQVAVAVPTDPEQAHG